MIDQFQRVAQKLRILHIPALVVGVSSILAIIATVFFSQSREGDRFLVPAIVALLWAMSTYGFIESFRSVPAPVTQSMSWFARLGRRLRRAWYWLIASIFIVVSVAAVFVALRMLAVWVRNYG